MGRYFPLLLVNDGSTKLDEISSRTLIEKNIRNGAWISYPHNVGKGHALRCGVAESTADLVVYTDVDWPYMEDSMVDVIRQLALGSKVVLGIRDEHYYSQLSFWRRYVSQWLQHMNKLLLKLQVNDTQAGLKGFHKDIKSIFLTTTIPQYLFDLEFVFLLTRQNIQITTVPVKLREGISFMKVNRKVLLQETKNFLKIWWKAKRSV